MEFPSLDGEEPVRVLFDPMFSERAGPSPWAGIRRRLPTPCALAELPDFHFVAISHNQYVLTLFPFSLVFFHKHLSSVYDSYDHLDMPCIQEIAQAPLRKDVAFLVPLGVKALIKSAGIPSERIHELDWWDEVTLPASGVGTTGPGPSLKFTSVPAQHGSGMIQLLL